MAAAGSEAASSAFTPLLPLQYNKVVLVMDLVESVRLMVAQEASVVMQWHGFVEHAKSDALPRFGGRLVKSLGDGILAEFDQAGPAVQCALALQRYFDPVNQTLAADQQLHLRAGLNATHLYVDANDVYGQGVNLAARVAGLAGPGETVITASVLDNLVEGIDGEVEDMGDSFLKHLPEPVRTWLVWPVSGNGLISSRQPVPAPVQDDLRPTIAVIPFECRSLAPEHQVIGEMIAEGVIAQLSRSGQLRVISRLSTTALRGRTASLEEVHTHLAAGFVLSGGYSVQGEQLVVMAELSDVRRNEVVWADRLGGRVSDLWALQSQLILELCDTASQALIECTVQRSLILPVPQLESNALLLGGIALMHRSTARDLDRSRELLEAVIDRHRRVARPWAWMAKWHVLNIVQGRSADAPSEFRKAIDLSDRALDMEPGSSLAMAIKGHVQCHLGSDLDGSRQLLLQATEVNPNDSTAWLYAGFWSTMWGDGNVAVRESERALALSPLDPQRFFIEMLVAHSYLQANQLEKTIEMCKQSLRRNRYYLATLRVLMTAQYEMQHEADALATLGTLKALQPGLTVSGFLAYGQQSPVRQRVAKTMEALGLPRN